MSDTPKVKLRVTSCVAAYSGRHGNDQHYTIYEIEAEKEDGTPIAQSLRSFEELPEGELIEVNVKRYDNPDYGTSYTLSRVGGSGREKKIKELESRITSLEETVSRLMEVVADATNTHTAG